jgi:hypothetical protein
MNIARLAICAALATAAPGLASAGDFGRPSPSVFDGLIPKQFFKGPVLGYSAYPLTDLEEELRDRSYVLIRPNEPRGNWNVYIAGFQIPDWMPSAFIVYDHTEYARMLLWTPARSEASSYNRLIEDMTSDGRLIAPFISVACAVADLDEKRARSLAYVSELSEGQADRAFGRIRENRMVTAWVQRALHWRLASYRYALERLVIAVPSRLAVPAERALTAFEQVVLAADRPLTQCSGEVAALPVEPVVVTGRRRVTK